MHYMVKMGQPNRRYDRACLTDTLDQARDTAQDLVWASGAFSDVDRESALQEARELPEDGGCVGPLPDGSVIDVHPLDMDAILASMGWDSEA